MPFVPTLNTVKLVFHQTSVDNFNVANIMYCGDPSGGHVYSLADLGAVANAAFTAWGNTFASYQVNGHVLNNVEAYDASSNTLPSATSTSTNQAGKVTGGCLPTQIAWLIRGSCVALGGKGDLQHIYVGGITSNHQTTIGHPDSTLMTAPGPWLTTFNTTLQGAVPNTQVMFVRFVRNKVRLTEGEAHAVAGWTSAPLFATQKRRKQGR